MLTAFTRAAALRRATEAMRRAEKAANEATVACTDARGALEAAGRAPQAVALDMICSSLTASREDLKRWQVIVQQDRAGDR